MRVLLDCRMTGWSGVGRYTTGLARALAARGDVELVQMCAPHDAAPVADGAVAFVAGGHPFGVRGALEFARLVRQVRADVVHCPHFPTPVPVGGPLVVTLHDLIPLVLPQAMPSTLRRTVYRVWNTRAARVADRLIVPSASTAADVERLLPKARGKVAVVPEAADDLLRGDMGTPIERQAQAISPAYVLSMGNTKWHKNLPTLLRAFGEVAAGRPDVLLVLVGPEPSGYLDEQLREAPSEIRSRVAFTGRVDDARLRALYAGTAAFVVPSLYEGFGLPVLEAMASGAPVVCSDATSLPEVAGEAAILFPARDVAALAQALMGVLDDPGFREDLSRRGRERAAQFTWEKTAAATVAVYLEAVGCA